ncbi:hypothetical protein [Flavobacterium sp.]|uniref:hypothetical protein n=1 Tax=Flavobacterium sp. TaxID=239 RepID=UPI0026294AE8|nr:hypothetical protein [Flavobacterium sp.]
MKKILPFFSYLFHPIFIPILGTLIYSYYGDRLYTQEQYYLLLFQVVIITFFLPLSFFYLLRTFGKVDTIMMANVKERKIPLLMQMVLTYILLQKSITVERFPELFFFFLGGFASTFIVFLLIYIRFKASVHMVAISALNCFVLGLSIHYQINCSYMIAALVVLSGVIATSRLYMHAHTLKELAVGYLCGSIPQLMFWYYWL